MLSIGCGLSSEINVPKKWNSHDYGGNLIGPFLEIILSRNRYFSKSVFMVASWVLTPSYWYSSNFGTNIHIYLKSLKKTFAISVKIRWDGFKY